jgi:hypothetical protein
MFQVLSWLLVTKLAEQIANGAAVASMLAAIMTTPPTASMAESSRAKGRPVVFLRVDWCVVASWRWTGRIGDSRRIGIYLVASRAAVPSTSHSVIGWQ